MNPNERRQGELCSRKRESSGGVTLNGLIWGAALREMPFLHAATLFLANVQQAHGTRNALRRIEMGNSLQTELVLTDP